MLQPICKTFLSVKVQYLLQENPSEGDHLLKMKISRKIKLFPNLYDNPIFPRFDFQLDQWVFKSPWNIMFLFPSCNSEKI